MTSPERPSHTRCRWGRIAFMPQALSMMRGTTLSEYMPTIASWGVEPSLMPISTVDRTTRYTGLSPGCSADAVDKRRIGVEWLEGLEPLDGLEGGVDRRRFAPGDQERDDRADHHDDGREHPREASTAGHGPLEHVAQGREIVRRCAGRRREVGAECMDP